MAPLPDFDKLEDFGGKFETNPKIDGVEMTSVADKSIAWYSGLRAGDIVLMDSLPTLPTGKIDREQLRSLAAQS